MSRRPCTFKQSDVTRLVKAVAAGGAKVARLEVGNDGRLIAILDGGEAVPSDDNELAKFRSEHGYN